MRKLVLVILALFALFTFINAYSEITPRNQKPRSAAVAEPGEYIVSHVP